MAWYYSGVERSVMCGFWHRIFEKKSAQHDADASLTFSYLQALVQGYFHQDFDIEGNSIADVIGSYKASANDTDVVGLKEDIARFKHQFADNADAMFVTLFLPDIDPVAWSGSTLAWLEEVEQALV